MSLILRLNSTSEQVVCLIGEDMMRLKSIVAEEGFGLSIFKGREPRFDACLRTILGQ